MNRKKITKAAVTGLVAVTMVPAMTAPIVANAEDNNNQTESGNPAVSENSLLRKVTVTVFDEVNNKTVAKQDFKLFFWENSISVHDVKIPYGYELAPGVGDTINVRNHDVVSIRVRPILKEQTIEINYWDVENNEQAGTGSITVDGTATEIDVNDLTDVPAGYEVVTTGKITIMDGSIYVEVKPVVPEKQEIFVNYWDVENNEQAGTGSITVDGTATEIDVNDLTDVPAGYEVVTIGKITIMDGSIYVEVKPVVPEKQEIFVNYWDQVNNVQAGTGSITVKGDADKVSTEDLTDIPAGYELVKEGEIEIMDGAIYVEVKPVEQEIFVNYWDVENNVQAAKGSIKVYATETEIDVKDLTDVPEGYELVTTGKVEIMDKAIYVEVKPVEQEIFVNYWDVENNIQAGTGSITVDGTVKEIAVDDLTDVPEGYELVTTGKVEIMDKAIYVEVKPIKEVTTQTVGVNYWDIENNVQVKEGEVTVAADAYNVNTSALTDIPEGYELVNLGDIQIMDGWIYVEVRPVATTKSVGLNYWDIVNNKQVSEGSVVVDADATKVNTSTFTDVPEGYELVWTGDLAINDGWVWVEVRPVEEVIPEEFLAQLNVQIVDRETDEVLKSIQFLSDEKGTADATYTFVYGEDWTVEAPEGYAFVEGTEFGDLDVAFGSQSTVEYYVEKTAEEPTQPGDEEEPNTPAEGTEEYEQTDGTDTGVAMSLAGVFGTMSAALAGMVALLRRKQK